VLYVGTTPGAKDVVGIDAGTATSATVNKIPTTGGTLYVTLYSKISGLFQHVSYTYTQYSGVPATMASPSPGSTLSGSTVTFNWTAGSNVSDYVIYVGTTPGAKDVAGVDAHTNTSATISNIPVNGGTIYVTLYSKIGGLFQNVAYTYTAFNGAPATMTSPTPGATLSGSGVTFNWSAGTNVTEYVIYVGTTPGAKDIAGVNTHSNTSATINNIPTNGATIYVTLYSKIGGLWTPQPYTYVTGP
jgi:hypothetical protein